MPVVVAALPVTDALMCLQHSFVPGSKLCKNLHLFSSQCFDASGGGSFRENDVSLGTNERAFNIILEADIAACVTTREKAQ